MHPVKRYRLVEPGALGGARRALYDKIVNGPRKTSGGRVPLVDDRERLLGPFGPMTIAPGVGAAVNALGVALRTQSQLSARVREIAILVIAAARRSEFEWFAHAPAAQDAGLDSEQIALMKKGILPDGLQDTERAAAQTVTALISRGTLDDDQYRRAEAVLGQSGLAELVWLTGYYSMLATALAVFDPDNPLSDGSRQFADEPDEPDEPEER
jgi:alkylhydroperoxidase family enzyme